jgi:hypothetical protein
MPSEVCAKIIEVYNVETNANIVIAKKLKIDFIIFSPKFHIIIFEKTFYFNEFIKI